MVPLTVADEGKEVIIRKIGGKEESRRFLENLGFQIGGTATVINDVEGHLIVNVKEARVALGKEMAAKIMVEMD